ncbi:MAG: glycosyltransferase, partial [Fimbriimonadales bacterium]|nr:glycosyltransferase [Fimbriimonadales bacterium]
TALLRYNPLDVPRPKVSVITPAYNVAPYLAQCIESVQAQTLTDWEMIIVDDASTDGTAQVAARYLADPRIRFLQNERNMGAGYTRNRALDAAQGEWIAVLDADDWYRPERLEKLVAFAEQMNADMVADLQVYYTEWGSVYTVAWASHAKPPKKPRFYTVEEVICAHPSIKPVIRAEFLRSREIHYAEHIRKSQDYAFYLEILLKGARFALLPEPMYYYRVHPNTVTTRHDPIAENRKSLEYLLSLPETTPRQRALLERAYRRMVMFALYPEFAQAVKRGRLKQAWRLFRRAPGVLGWLLQSVPAAVYRRLFAREQMVDPWRESVPTKLRR